VAPIGMPSAPHANWDWSNPDVSSKLRIVVTGLVAQHPRLGGVAWDYVQYPAGLARLGHDVYYLEDSGEWPYVAGGGASRESWIAHDPTPNIRHLASVMERFGLGDRWLYRFPIRSRWYGLSHRKRREVLASADLLVNVSGTLKRPSDYRQIPRLAYVDSDPAFTQVKLTLPRGQKKFQKRFVAHDAFFSFGERIGETELANGIDWWPTRQPILLSEWRPGTPARDVFTTVMSWTSYKPLRYGGRSFGQKDVEFRRFVDLPRVVRPARLEVALGGTRQVRWEATDGGGRARDDRTPREVLEAAGWRVVDAASVSGDLDAYRRYVESSKAEWSVAKNGYVTGETGWFSCRSACYLAAGRPVVVEDTRFGDVLPVGEGICSFRTPDEAAEAVREVEGGYARHARAAREIAGEYFDSDRVLARLVEEAMR
jgi:hypothetical protein